MLEIIYSIIELYLFIGTILTLYFTSVLCFGNLLKNKAQMYEYRCMKDAYIDLLKHWNIEHYSLMSYIALVFTTALTLVYSVITWPTTFEE